MPGPVTLRFSVAGGATDTTAPETFLTGAPTGRVSATTDDVDFHANEPARFQCRRDGGPWTRCEPQNAAMPYLALGTHTFSVRALDAAGTADPTPATTTWIQTDGSSTTGATAAITGSTGSIQFTTVGGSGGQPFGAYFGNHLGWYGGPGEEGLTWTPSFSGKVTFDTAGSGYDTVLTVYTNGSNGVEKAWNDDNSSGTSARVTLSVVAGTEYLVDIRGYPNATSGANGNGVLAWNESA
jgi:hypothetical protein